MGDQIFVFGEVQSLLSLGDDAITSASVSLDIVDKSPVVVRVASVVVDVGVLVLFGGFRVVGELQVEAVAAVVVNDGAALTVALADVVLRGFQEVVKCGRI